MYELVPGFCYCCLFKRNHIITDIELKTLCISVFKNYFCYCCVYGTCPGASAQGGVEPVPKTYCYLHALSSQMVSPAPCHGGYYYLQVEKLLQVGSVTWNTRVVFLCFCLILKHTCACVHMHTHGMSNSSFPYQAFPFHPSLLRGSFWTFLETPAIISRNQANLQLHTSQPFSTNDSALWTLLCSLLCH